MDENGVATVIVDRPSRRITGWTIAVCLLLGLLTPTIFADDFHAGFEQPDQTAWTVRFKSAQLRLSAHQRTDQQHVDGQRSEMLTLVSEADGISYQIEHDLPEARLIDELQVAVSVRSNRPGLTSWFRVVFPNEMDPQTRKPLTAFVSGDAYRNNDQWQRLVCAADSKQLQGRIRELRVKLNRPSLNTDGAYVNRVLLTGQVGVGETQVFLDNLQFGPLVDPRQIQLVQENDKPASQVELASFTETDTPAGPAGELRLGRFLVEGRPFFPIIAAQHTESPELLKELGLNVVGIPDYEDQAALAALREQNLWAMATPPRAVDANGLVIDARDVSVLPFGPETRPILIWNLGTRVPASAKDELFAWVDQVQTADRNFDRPIAVEVIGGEERSMSRRVPLLGMSRHVANTTFGYKQKREWFLEKRKLARMGSFEWTWIQTEPAPSLAAMTAQQDGGHPVVIEPEQLRLQVYSAVAAGIKGIGYWKRTPFDDNSPGATERRLAITQLNLELSLLQPFLATGSVSTPSSFSVDLPSAQSIRRGTIDFRTTSDSLRERDAMLREQEYQRQRASRVGGELEATVISSSEYGKLVLPIWYGTDAQFVPGQMAARNARIVVAGVDDFSSAWEVSPTKIVPLTGEGRVKRGAGGLEITLKQFDQTSAIIITRDRELIDAMRRKVAQIAPQSAAVCVALAREKLERVRRIDEELQSLGASQPDGPQILARSQEYVMMAEDALARGSYQAASEAAGRAMQLQRILQKAHWNDAVRSLPSPMSSPYTICYQTLPDHWRLMQRIGQSDFSSQENLLKGGNFEDADTFFAAGGKHEGNDIPGVHAGADLYPSKQEGNYSLRLHALPIPQENPPEIMPTSPVIIKTPPVSVKSGQVIHVSGWVRIPNPIQRSLDGVMLFDNIAGPAAALRWTEAGEWKQFFFLREVPETGPYELTLQLTGLGEVQFDDLRVIAQDQQIVPAPEPTPTESGSPFSYPFKLLEKLPKWNTNPFRR